jgi:hypothetical protein
MKKRALKRKERKMKSPQLHMKLLQTEESYSIFRGSISNL